MTYTQIKKPLAHVLWAFALVSVGVAIGKELSHRPAAAPIEPAAVPGQSKVVVYYMHGVPCRDCTSIEKATERIVHEEFADAVQSGRMEFISVNYLEQEQLANKYKVGGNMVIAVPFPGGLEAEAVRMDKVMELVSTPAQLEDYIRQGLRRALEGAGK